MARILILDPKHYLNGNVTLTREDQWVLDAKVVDVLPGQYQRDVDLTGSAPTAYFPQDPDVVPAGAIAGSISLTNPTAGEVRLTLPVGDSANAPLTVSGLDLYLEILDTVLGLQTISTQNQPLLIRDRGFSAP
jgi:hypothetical protein